MLILYKNVDFAMALWYDFLAELYIGKLYNCGSKKSRNFHTHFIYFDILFRGDVYIADT